MEYKMGQPLPFGPQPSEYPVATFGDYDAHNGLKMSIESGQLVVHGDLEGTILTFGVDLMLLLEAIGTYNHQFES